MIMCENLKTMFVRKEQHLSSQLFTYIMHVKTSKIVIGNEEMYVEKGEQFYITYDSKEKMFNVYRGVFSLGMMKRSNVIYSFTEAAAQGRNNKKINQFMSQFVCAHRILFCSIHFDEASWCIKFSEITRKMRPVKTIKKISLANGGTNLIIQIKDLSRLKPLINTYEEMMENEMDVRIQTSLANQLVDSGFLVDIDLAEYSIFAE